MASRLAYSIAAFAEMAGEADFADGRVIIMQRRGGSKTRPYKDRNLKLLVRGVGLGGEGFGAYVFFGIFVEGTFTAG